MTPSSWMTAHRHLLPPRGTALDVACGRGRNSLWLANEGFTTRAVDRDAIAIRLLNDEARRLGLPLTADVIDLEQDFVGFEAASYDVVVVMHYLHRPLFPTIVAAL